MKYVALLIAMIVAILVFRLQSPQKVSLPFVQKSVTPSPIKISPDYEIKLGEYTFATFWQKIDAATLKLIPNFDEKRTASEIIEREQCSYGASGGFYTTDNKPTGLFISDGTNFSSSVTNATFNGFFIKNQNTISIQLSPPNSPLDFALQSGPYMTPKTKLGIRNDSLARRVLVARTQNNTWYFLAITEKDNSFNGPLLAAVPDILGKLPLGISEALNLDGGSASAFYSARGARLGELTPIGSFFCGKR